MSESIRVLQVFAQMNRGGAETMIMNLYRNIDRSKVQFDFIVHTEEKCAFDDEIVQLGGKIYRVPKYSGKNHFHYRNGWVQFFNSHPEYKIIHGHVRSTASIYLTIAKKYSLTTIAHSHSTSSGNGLTAIIKNLLQFKIKYVADYLFACSKPAGIWLFGESACKKDNFYIIKNAIDTKVFHYDVEIRSEKRSELGINNKFVIGHIGRFDAPKNHSFLIDIFKEIHNINSNALLLLVGDGDLRPLIETKITDLGLSDSVILTGVRSDVSDLLNAMDLFLFPSLYEGLGIVTIEAQATELYCVVSDTIPKEVYVTNLIESISLNEDAKVWAKEVVSIHTDKYERINDVISIKRSGYDILETSNWIENFYLQVTLNDNLG
jgi:glycosyltransferase involved in cell wall biosynthesis